MELSGQRQAALPTAIGRIAWLGDIPREGVRDQLTRLQSQDLLEILEDRYGRSSTSVATQVPIAEWHVGFPDPMIGDAIVDRWVHNAHRLALKGQSRRKIDSSLPTPTT